MPGLNSEIVHKDSRFHIQTQDKGQGAYYVESIIYKAGKVLSTRKSFYTAFLENKNLEQKIKEIIESQHYGVMNEILEGRFDHL